MHTRAVTDQYKLWFPCGVRPSYVSYSSHELLICLFMAPFRCLHAQHERPNNATGVKHDDRRVSTLDISVSFRTEADTTTLCTYRDYGRRWMLRHVMARTRRSSCFDNDQEHGSNSYRQLTAKTSAKPASSFITTTPFADTCD